MVAGSPSAAAWASLISTGYPVRGSYFPVETAGRLPGGTTLAGAFGAVERAAAADYYLVNCAHPTHLQPGLDGLGELAAKILGVRYNASIRSHAELDEATELDAGDFGLLARSHQQVAATLPALTIIGGCCGTDARHVAALWADTPLWDDTAQSADTVE